MATTKVDICARALILVGASPITSFDDGSTEALVASNIYTDIAEAALCRQRWRFATTHAQPSLIIAATTGRYKNAYQMTTDPAVLQINTLTVNDYVIAYDRYKDKIYLNGHGSTSTVIMDYIFKVEEEFFPAHFRLALEYQLAAVFAGSVARDNDMIKSFTELAERQFMVSKHIDSVEKTNAKLDLKRFKNLRLSTRTNV